MNTNKLKAKMLLCGDTGEILAQFLNISRTTLSLKMQKNNKEEFTQGEILKMKNIN